MTDDRSKQELIDELAEAYRALDEERDKTRRKTMGERGKAVVSVVRDRIVALDKLISSKGEIIKERRKDLAVFEEENQRLMAERAQLLAFLGEER
jgi:hypothetical protein